MRQHRFLIPGLDLASAEALIEDAALVRQWRTVLRYRPGASVLLGDGRGSEAAAEILAYGDEGARVRIGSPDTVAGEPARRVEVYAAITRRDTFEWSVQKATECGVSRVVPLIAERTVKQNVSLDRLRSIAREAAEQSWRGFVPEIGEPIRFEDLVQELGGTRLIATLAAPSLQELAKPARGTVAIAIGPEGGFSPREVALATAAGWQEVGLGPRTLRAETAVAIAAYLLAAE